MGRRGLRSAGDSGLEALDGREGRPEKEKSLAGGGAPSPRARWSHEFVAKCNALCGGDRLGVSEPLLEGQEAACRQHARRGSFAAGSHRSGRTQRKRRGSLRLPQFAPLFSNFSCCFRAGPKDGSRIVTSCQRTNHVAGLFSWPKRRPDDCAGGNADSLFRGAGICAINCTRDYQG